jgi:hypothetical protein
LTFYGDRGNLIYMNIKWNIEKLTKEALKYNFRGEFQKHSPSAYTTARSRELLDQICLHMDSLTRSWSTEELQIEANKYQTKQGFREGNPAAYSYAHKRKIIDKICSHMLPQRKKWAVKDIKLEALKHTYRIDFQINSPSAYRAALRLRIMDEVCSHMEYHCYPWTDEELRLEALKYKTRGEFYHKSPAAHLLSLRRGIIEKICSHMKESSNCSLVERKILHEIRKIYPAAKTLKDRRAKIEGKPYIHGFDIDIYIPELKKGIEFDGKYWHSLEQMKKSKPNWPHHDLIDYHEIKDGYFKSKGIEILHIKEEDWIKNEKICLRNVFIFLSQHIQS